MSFTAGQIFRAARVHAPELRKVDLDPESVAAAFNAALLDLVLEVVDCDSERLAVRYTVPSAVVAMDPIDLTDDGTGTGARDWLFIDYIDWRDADDEGDEVAVTTQESRNRASDDFDGLVIGILEDQLRKLRQVAGWDSVETLVIYGVLRPTEVTGRTLDSASYDYPAALESALAWEMVAQLAADLPSVHPTRVAVWEKRRAEARDRLFADAGGHVGGRIESIPWQSEV